MNKTFWVTFGSGDPRTWTGLKPSFLIFQTSTGTTAVPPGISELITGTGLYSFSYSLGISLSMGFLIDGATNGFSNTTDRYVKGSIDGVQFVDQTANTVNAAVGTTSDSFGTTSIDPTTFFGYLKRMQELQEGDSAFNKSTGTWAIYSRSSMGSSGTLLRDKTLTNAQGIITKTGN